MLHLVQCQILGGNPKCGLMRKAGQQIAYPNGTKSNALSSYGRSCWLEEMAVYQIGQVVCRPVNHS